MKTGDLIVDNSDGVVLLFIKWWVTHCWGKRAYLFDFRTQQTYDYTEEEIQEHLEVISYG